MLIRRRLMLDKHVDISITCSGFEAVEDVAEILAEVILNERTGLQFQRAEIADGAQFCRQMQLHKIPRNIRLRQELPERGIVGSGCAAFLLGVSLDIENYCTVSLFFEQAYLSQ